MANGIIPVQWGKELRPSAVNSLDKINEVIHFINQSDIHEFTFSDSGSGESVQTANSTQLLDLTVYGKSVQDGTPTPDSPVPVQVVGGRNLLQSDAQTKTINGVTFTKNSDGSITANGTATAGITYDYHTLVSAGFLTIPAGFYVLSGCPSGGSGSTYKLDIETTSGTYATDYGSGFTFTISSPRTYRRARIVIYNGQTVENLTFKPQLEAGTQATPYLPYGCIGLQIGETVTPIDLQGHTLAGLPDGTRDELDINAAGVKEISQKVTYERITGSNITSCIVPSSYPHLLHVVTDIVVPTGKDNVMSDMFAKVPGSFSSNAYDGEVCGVYDGNGTVRFNIELSRVSGTDLSDAQAWADANKPLFYYPLAEPQTIELGEITPPAIPDGSIIKINTSLTPVIDVEWFTEDTLPKMMNSILGLIKSLHPDEFTASEGNALHSINPINISKLEPISDIQPIGEVETGYGHEKDNESEVQ